MKALNTEELALIVDGVENLNPKGFWFWVTNKKYYFNDGGYEKEDLEPMECKLSWTCDEQTQKGDLAFLYRTSPMTDVKYVMQAISDAYEVVEGGEFSGWYQCKAIVIFKFRHSLLSKEMKLNENLMNSDPVRRNYQGNKGSFELTGDEWFEINEILLKRNHEYWKFIDLLTSKKSLFEDYFPKLLDL